MRLAIPLPVLLIPLYTNLANTGPLSLKAEPEYAQLLDRAACFLYCGYSSQLCCSAGYVCSTDQNSRAQCATSVYNPAFATAADFAATSTSTLICNGNQGQMACGDKCCAAGQTCVSPGQCNGTSPTPAPSTPATTATVTSVPAAAAGQSAPATVTTTAVAATVTTSSTTVMGNSGLDGGSIAGIVIGVIVGVLVLAWMCAPLTNRNNPALTSGSSSRSSRGRGSRRSRR